MREVIFLKKNAEKWQEFESLLVKADKNDAEVLADLYIEISNDLAYSRSNYPTSKTTTYLNDLAVKAHNQIYKNKKEDRGRFIRFWAEEIPLIFGNHQKELLYSFVIFMVAFLIGVLSSALDDNFSRVILSDRYVNLTIDNIEKGDPLAIYKDEHAMNMFLGITINNVRVSFLAFVAGLASSLGTGYILLSNGIMVGAFLQFFFKFGLLSQALLVIFIHGALELSAIVIAGASGLVLGNSLLFPGTYSRKDSFLKGVKVGLKMIVGLVPIFIIAGFLESFVTRYTEMPVWLSLSIIISSFTFIIYYFVWLPQKLTRSLNGKN